MSIFLLSASSSIFAQHTWADVSTHGTYNITTETGPDRHLRSVKVHIPSSPFNKKFPVIIWLHGTMPARAIEVNKNWFGTLPDDLQFIGVVPHSLEIQNTASTGTDSASLAWNHAPASPSFDTNFPSSGYYTGRDVAYLKLIIEKLKEYAPVKEGNHIYFMGHSSGGFMTMKMGMMVEECGGISPSGASFHKGSNYAIGDTNFAQPVSYSKLVVSPSDPKIRVVHLQGECDDKALWNGNLRGDGQTPSIATGGTTDCDPEKSNLPIYPILGNRFVEGTGYLYAQHNTLRSGDLRWTRTTSVYTTPIRSLDITQYAIRQVNNKDVIVLKIHGEGHGAPDMGGIDLKADRIRLLLGRIDDLPEGL